MAAFDSQDIPGIMSSQLSGLDEDVMEYLTAIVDGMTLEERRTCSVLQESIGPFLLDAGAVSTEEEIETSCMQLVKAFGGSGFQSSTESNLGEPYLTLLSAPVKLIEKSGLNQKKPATYGGVVFSNLSAAAAESGEISDLSHQQQQQQSSPSANINHNSTLDAKSIPTTQKQLRKMKKENDRLQKILRAEEIARMAAEAEMADARMAAIRANRTGGRQAATGISIERFSIPHPSGTSDLLTDAALVLATGHRYGLVGKNGAGKSTLMRHLANYKLPGLMHMRILLVDQHVEGDQDSPMQWVLRADVERTALLEDERRLLEAQAQQALKAKGHNLQQESGVVTTTTTATSATSSSSSKSRRIDASSDVGTTTAAASSSKNLGEVDVDLALIEVYERMEAIGVRTAEERAQKILLGLGFSTDSIHEPTRNLSGGWAMRAALAAALYVKPDLLLLDEPTNHLDLHALVWLERWLTERFAGILLVVSHDQVFLNRVCTDMFELRSTLVGHSKSALTHYAGNYLTYESTKLEQKIAQQRLRDAYEKEKEKLQEFISREGKKYDNPAHQAQRKMKMKQLQKLMEVDTIEIDSELVMHFPVPYGVFGGNENLISVKNASFGWGHNNSSHCHTDIAVDEYGGGKSATNVLFENVDFIISSQARIAILGKNGSGKTCLLKMLVGELPPISGIVTRHVGCRIATLQQHHYKGEQLDPNLNSLEHMRRLPQEESTSVGLHDRDTRQEETAQRSYLSNFGITGNTALLPARFLSGGQRMRVAMAVALYRRPDLLILDEPTNHLDADTVRALCEALSTFKGAIVAVSHDESFVNQVINSGATATNNNSSSHSKHMNNGLGGELWVLSRKQLQRFDGTFSDYKKIIAKKVARGEEM